MIKFTQWVAGWMFVGTLLVSGSSGLVLCIGNGGHVALEPAHHEHSEPGGNTAYRTHPEAVLSMGSAVVNGDGGCVDVSLGLDNVSHVLKNMRQDRLLKNRISKDSSAGSVALTSAELRVQRLACGATPRLSHTLLEQRTVVLLI